MAAVTAVAVPAAQVRHAASADPQPKPSLFGIDTGTFDSVKGHYAKDFVRARNLGARWVHFTGDSIHWSNGRPDYSVLDSGVSLAKKQGLGILISLGGDPNACSVSPAPSDVTNCPPTTTHDLQAYKIFLKQELLRYAPEVTYFESWVEPNTPVAGRRPQIPDSTRPS